MRCLAIFVLLALAVLGDGNVAPNSPLTFALIAKNVNNDFFTVVRDGCKAQAALTPNYNVTCLYLGPEADDAVAQAAIVDAIINGTYGNVDGISISVSDTTITGEAIDRAVEAGIPVITFDSDAKGSLRKAYIGTDNHGFGEVLGKLLQQVSPVGGKLGIVAASAPNVVKRVNGAREQLMNTNSKWVEVDDSWKDCLDSTEVALELMYEFADEEDVDAIISVGGWPMFDPVQWKKFVDSHRDLTLIVGDTLTVQVELMNTGYVDGLVGQLPFNMGEMSIDVLMKIVLGQEVEETIYGTALLEFLKFPLVLPLVHVNENYLGTLSVLAYILFILVAIASIGLMVWTFLRRNTRVIKASQPFFLQMIIAGVLVLATAMIPLTFDSEQHSQKQLDAACMATPWLAVIGYTTIFSALYAKTWRINRIFHNPNKFKRIKITEWDVIKPYFLILTLNIITLTCWTVIAPLTYRRFDNPGTDDWNRVISTYGLCTSQSKAEGEGAGSNLPYLIVLGILNVGLLILANAQAYQARTIQTEYSESKYIAIINASILQALLLATPMIFLLYDQPRAYYTVLVMVVFCICSVVLLFMFWPKIYHTQIWLEQKKEKERKRAEQRAKVIGDGGANASSGSMDRRESNAADGLKIAVRPSARFDSTARPQNGLSVLKEIEEQPTQRRSIALSSASEATDDGNTGLRISVSTNKPAEFRSSFREKEDGSVPPTVRFEQSSVGEDGQNEDDRGEAGAELENGEDGVQFETLDDAREEIKLLKQRLAKYE